MTKDTKNIEPHPKLIWPYLAWTFGWTWGFWVLAILLKNLGPENLSSLANVVAIVGSLGPVIGTKMVLQLSFRELWTYIFSRRTKTWFFLILLMVVEPIIYTLSSKGWSFGQPLWSVPLLFIYILILGGGQEEIGWRGLLQPALEKRFRFWEASLLTGLAWAGWHLPLWFMPGSAQAGTPFLIFALDVLVISFVFAGLYKHSRSIWYCMLFHTFHNLLSSFIIEEGYNDVIHFIGLGIMALYASWTWYQTDRKEKADA